MSKRTEKPRRRQRRKARRELRHRKTEKTGVVVGIIRSVLCENLRKKNMMKMNVLTCMILIANIIFWKLSHL